VSAPPRDHPRARAERLRDLRGEADVARGCVALLEEREVDDEVLAGLGGTGSAARDAAFLSNPTNAYWARVWGARGLLYVWDDAATPALRRAVRDEHWRVREMVAKVVARRRLDVLAGAVAGLQADPVPRVRAAAERALVRLAAPT
jgi:hypothetical protein